MIVPDDPKIYHIIHVDRLESVVRDNCLWCDREVIVRSSAGTSIGMSDIKRRRLEELRLHSHQNLFVGDCVPFYFCPRSVMLYLIYRANHPGLTYRGGQDPIVHLEADLHEVIGWANTEHRRWAFTLSNAGARYFDDRCTVDELDQVDWEAVQANDWSGRKEGKQAEFLIERSFPWSLVRRIGVHSQSVYQDVHAIMTQSAHNPAIAICPEWYY